MRLLPNTKPVIKSELDPSYYYLQIISLDIYFTPEELEQRQSLFEQNFNISKFLIYYFSEIIIERFIYEIPLIKGLNSILKRK